MRFMNFLKLIFLILIVSLNILPKIAMAQSDWLMHGYDARNSFWNREEKSLYPPLKEAWRYSPAGTQAALENVVVSSEVTFLSSMADGDKNVVFAVNAQTGNYKWKFTLTGGGSGAMGVAPAVYKDPVNQLVFFGGQRDNNLYAVNINNGYEQWRTSGISNLYGTNPKIAGGTIYINSNEGWIMGINVRDGRKIWELSDIGNQSDIVIEEGVLIQGSVYGSPLVGIGTLQGNKIWETNGKAQSYLSAWNGIVFVAYTGESPTKLPDYPYYKYDRIAAFNVRTGQKMWEKILYDDLVYGCMAVTNSVLYVVSIKNQYSSAKGVLYALNPRTGDIIKQRNDNLSITRMVVANDIIYAGGWNNKTLYALNAKTLETVWETDLGAKCTDLIVANSHLYVVLGRSGLVVYENQVDGRKGPESGVTETTGKRDELGNYGKKYAIIIGISDYKNLPEKSENKGALIDLKYTQNDAKAFRDFLKTETLSGGNWDIRYLVNEQATTYNVDNALTSVLTSANQRDLIFIFFSGHGRSHPLREKDVYLLTCDFEVNDYRSGFAYRDLLNLIADSRAEHIIAFIDACHSGTIGFSKGQSKGSFDQDAFGERLEQIPENKVVFSSGRGTQLSWEDPNLHSSVFTYYLLKGLHGEAEEQKNPDFVDLGELAEYVQKNVLEHTSKAAQMDTQYPQLFEASGVTNEDFPVAIRVK